MEKLKQLWLDFEKEHPKASKWIREGGLFFLVSNGITIVRGFFVELLHIIFTPLLGVAPFGFPGIPIRIFGVEFDWYILGYGEGEGTSYFMSFIIGTVIFEIINFFIQRGWVFRSKGNLIRQFLLYFLAFCVVIPIVNSINCFWVELITNETIRALGTTIITGGVAMVVFFFVNRIIFNDAPEAEGEKPEEVKNEN